MRKKLIITVDADIHGGLRDNIGPRRINRFLIDLARPFVFRPGLAAGYADTAADEAREAEAGAWHYCPRGA